MSLSIRTSFVTAGTAYLQMASSIVCSLLTLKVATTWLSNEALGLWGFLFATVSYFTLLEFGFGQAVGRLLGEPLAAKQAVRASQYVTTGLAILVGQGILVMLLGLWANTWRHDDKQRVRRTLQATSRGHVRS